MSKAIIANVRSDAMMRVEALDKATRMRTSAVANRLLWLADAGDALVLPRPPQPRFLHYLHTLGGPAPGAVNILAPADRPPEGRPLDRRALLDDALVAELARVVDPSWELLPYLHDRSTATLSRRLGLKQEQVDVFHAQGGAEILNNKAFFRAWAVGTDTPVAHGMVCRSDTAAPAAAELLREHRCVIVKQDLAAGGHGNLVLTTDSATVALGADGMHLLRPGPGRPLEEEIARVLREERFTPGDQAPPAPGTRHSETIVEVFHPASRSLWTELMVPQPPEEPVLLNYGDMRMEPVWNGFAFPALDLPERARQALLDGSRDLARTVQRLGYRGHLNCDAILTPDGELLFSEVNARLGGCTHIHHLATRLLGEDYLDTHVLLTRNDLPTPPFEQLLDRLEAEGLAWQPGRDGVVILVDDTALTGTVEYLVIGSDAARAHQVEHRLRTLFT